MHYCSLQHRTWLSPPDTFATEHRFCFGSVVSFSLDPLIINLHYPSGILDTLPPGGLIFWCDIFLPFILSMEFSRQEYWSGLPFPSPVDMLSELFSMTSLSLVALTAWLRASLSYAGPFTMKVRRRVGFFNLSSLLKKVKGRDSRSGNGAHSEAKKTGAGETRGR